MTTANSLTGTTSNDQVGYLGITVLANGHYVVTSPYWKNHGTAMVGAVTWRDGTQPRPGAISLANSLLGVMNDDIEGIRVTALANGHYVVASPFVTIDAIDYAGAATWGNGGGGTTGMISAANSLVGAQRGDLVGIAGVTALANGNYVVASPWWHNDSNSNAGAATWCDGTAARVDVVSTKNSLVGANHGDGVGSDGITTRERPLRRSQPRVERRRHSVRGRRDLGRRAPRHGRRRVRRKLTGRRDARRIGRREQRRAARQRQLRRRESVLEQRRRRQCERRGLARRPAADARNDVGRARAGRRQ